jgi:hypothetical protein
MYCHEIKEQISKPETLPPRGCSTDKLQKNTASLAAACNVGAVGPDYLWLIGTSKEPLEANTLKGENSTHKNR